MMPTGRAMLILIAAGALAAAAAHQAAGTPSRAAATGGARLSDAELEKAIQARFANSKIAVNRFTVRVQGGVATLEGRTDVLQHKGTATRLAKAAGARKVVNRIEVSEKARQKASASLAQGRRREQIKRGESVPRSQPR